jgi:hypothetical protein
MRGFAHQRGTFGFSDKKTKLFTCFLFAFLLEMEKSEKVVFFA